MYVIAAVAIIDSNDNGWKLPVNFAGSCGTYGQFVRHTSRGAYGLIPSAPVVSNALSNHVSSLQMPTRLLERVM